MTFKSQFAEFTGKYIAVGLVLLTAIVGTLFIYLGPKATQRTPGVIHVGIRYLNEGTFDFLRYGKHGPGATIQLVASDGEVVYEFSDLKIGRNLIPLDGVKNGNYTARLSSNDYLTTEVAIIVEGRMLNPPKGIEFEPGTHADYNMIGVWFKPTPKIAP
jgi:hypothetical protein